VPTNGSCISASLLIQIYARMRAEIMKGSLRFA
jgi:hypothetical protein